MGDDRSIDDFVPADTDDESGGDDAAGDVDAGEDGDVDAGEDSDVDAGEDGDVDAREAGDVDAREDGDVDAREVDDATAPGADDAAAAAETAGPDDAVVSPSSVTPAASTSRVVPDGEACSACDAVVARLWFDGEDAVCAACKSW